MASSERIDLHMHTIASDGTDDPTEIIQRVKEAGLSLFAVTDHDTIEACVQVAKRLGEGDPAFLFGVEFSCRDEEGRYHILGYGYDPASAPMREIVEKGHNYRMEKLGHRLRQLESRFGFTFSEEDQKALYALKNPGKPHIGNLMVKYGYASTKDEAIISYLNQCKAQEKQVHPQEAIQAIIEAGGIAVLAHPSYGRGDERILGTKMDGRLRRLIGFGLKGVEAFYSGFSPALQDEILSFADRYGLYVTAGSDYHGRNKTVRLGDTHLDSVGVLPKGMEAFLRDVRLYPNNM